MSNSLFELRETEPLDTAGYAIITLGSIICLIGLIFNGFIITTIAFDKSGDLKNSSTVSLFLIAVCDCVVCLVASITGFSSVHVGHWAIGFNGCMVCFFLLQFFEAMMLFSVVLYALDQFLLVVYGYVISWKRVPGVIGVAVLLSSVFTSAPFWSMSLMDYPTLNSIRSHCFVDFTDQKPFARAYSVILALAVSLVPIVTGYCYREIHNKITTASLSHSIGDLMSPYNPRHKTGSLPRKALIAAQKASVIKGVSITACNAVTWGFFAFKALYETSTGVEIPIAMEYWVATLICICISIFNPVLIYFTDYRISEGLKDLFNISSREPALPFERQNRPSAFAVQDPLSDPSTTPSQAH